MTESHIEYLGKIQIPGEMRSYAVSIRHQNYTINTPSKFQKRNGENVAFKQTLSKIIDWPVDEIDYVFFSCPCGAEPHVDKLNLSKFRDDTVIIPVIVQDKESILRVSDEEREMNEGELYKFKHTTVHSVTHRRPVSDCVLIMAARLK